MWAGGGNALHLGECTVRQDTVFCEASGSTHGAMLPFTAPSGADPDCYHHSCFKHTVQRRLHHRGPHRPHQDLHLWVFKGRGSCSRSAHPAGGQVCIEEIWQAALGRGDGGAHSTAPCLTGGQSYIDLTDYSALLFFVLFSQVTDEGTDEDKDSTTFSSSQTISSETTSGTTVTTTTTQISKVSSTDYFLLY